MNLPKNITTIQEVESFANYLVNTEHINFNPDEDFRSYVSYETKEPTYTEKDAIKRNKLMEECFIVCEHNGADIYEIMGKYLIDVLKLNM